MISGPRLLSLRGHKRVEEVRSFITAILVPQGDTPAFIDKAGRIAG